MSETKPGETTGSSHIASLKKDVETLETLLKAVQKKNNDANAAEVFAKRFANVKLAVDSLKAGETPIDRYNKVRTAVSASLKEFPKLAKELTKPTEVPKVETSNVITFTATPDGAKELLKDKSAKMPQAIKNALDDSGGRAGPKIEGIASPFYHIHVGGNAKNNLLYRGNVILGLIDFHIDKTNNAQQKLAVKEVANRKGTVNMQLEDDTISKA